ncbi:F0F1 ATP synthase subunit gamma [bacterium]|nr:F0F1 ATP synthase subunit gamma [bacterium]
MSSKKDLQETLNLVEAISVVTGAYQEIARTKMNQIRAMVIKNREFLERLSVVYFSVKSSYLHSLSPHKKEREKARFFIQKNNKEVVIFLSSNQPFYGNLILNIYLETLDYLKYHKNADFVVVGRLGKFLVESHSKKARFEYFELSDDNLYDKDNLRKIVDFVKQYKTITVFYGKFINPFVQKPAMADISGNLIISQGSLLESLTLGDEKFLFEPSPEKVLSFFETEIVASLFNQIVWEHHLAKFASRMMAMYQATENAKEEKAKILRKIRRLKKQIINKKQIIISSGFRIWSQKRKKQAE